VTLSTVGAFGDTTSTFDDSVGDTDRCSYTNDTDIYMVTLVSSGDTVGTSDDTCHFGFG